MLKKKACHADSETAMRSYTETIYTLFDEDRNTMNKLIHFILVVLALTIVAGCKIDPPIYYTPLPGGLEHVSNGGELGWIGLPTATDSWTQVYPDEEGWYCNEFAVIGDNVIGVEIVYADRAFVDPPVNTRWFFLDTTKRTARTFQSLAELENYCRDKGFSSIPEFSTRTPETSRKSRGSSKVES